MKKKGIIGAIMIALLCAGCVHDWNAVTIKADNDFQLPEVKSVISQEECRICGNNERSLMPYYRKSGMLLSGKLNDVPSGRLFRADLGFLQMCQSL